VSSTSLPRCQGRCAGKFSLNLNCGKRLRFADLSEGSRRSSGCVLVWVRHRLAVWPRFGLVTSPVGASPTVADEGMTPRSSIFAYLVPAKEEALSKDIHEAREGPNTPTWSRRQEIL
jgi:hypothetical protein